MVPLHLLGRLLLCYSAGGRKAFSLPGNSPTNERLSQLSQWKVTMLPILSSSNRLFVYYSTLISFSTLLKEFSACSLGLAQWLSLAIDRICNSLLISSKPIFAGEITIVCFRAVITDFLSPSTPVIIQEKPRDQLRPPNMLWFVT